MHNLKYKVTTPKDLTIILSWFTDNEKSFTFWAGTDFTKERALDALIGFLTNHNIELVSVFNEKDELIAYYELHSKTECLIKKMIGRFVVRPQDRRIGIGKSVMMKIISDAISLGIGLELIVYLANLNALNLYLKMGFVSTSDNDVEIKISMLFNKTLFGNHHD